MSEPRLRLAARALIIDAAERVLLVRMAGSTRTVWVTPGGGIEGDETDEEAVRRELLEETGLETFQLGALVWTRTALMPLGDGRWEGETERIYLVRTEPFEPAPRLSWEALRSEGMTAIHWWTPDELETADALFAPRRLPVLLRELLRDGPPPEPIDVGL